MLRSLSLGLALAVSLSLGCASAHDDTATDDGAATAGSALSADYQGTIGSLNVYMHLASVGAVGSLTGSYFYADKDGTGDALLLKGGRSGSNITLTESVNGAGATTGTFTGTVSAAGIKGQWKAPNGSWSPLALTPIKPGVAKIVMRKFKNSVPYTGTNEFLKGETCALDATQIEFFGMADAKAEAAINKALAVAPLALDKSGKCTDDVDSRSIESEIVMNQIDGFTTISVSEEDDGGAHPENSIQYFNFRMSDGAQLGPKDFFVDGFGPALKKLVVANINADKTLDADTKKDTLDELDTQWPADFDATQIAFGVNQNGISLNMMDIYPHVVLAEAPMIDFTWADLKPILKTGSPIAALVK